MEQALERLITELPELEVNDFYGIIFSFTEEKFNLCREFLEEMRIVNMAALNLKEEANTEKVTAALILCIGAIINKYLEIYKEMPNSQKK